MTPEERAEARLIERLRKASRLVVPSVLHAKLHAEAAYALEAAVRERDRAQAIVNVVDDKVIPTLHRLSREPRCGHHAEDALRALGVEP